MSKISISYVEYLFLREKVKTKPKKTFVENCFLKLYDKILKLDLTENSYDTNQQNVIFLTEYEADERDKFKPNANFNILVDVLRDSTDETTELLRTNKYGLVEYTNEEFGKIYIQLPYCNCLVKLVKKNKDITFIHCFPSSKEYLVARDVLSHSQRERL